MEYNEETHTQNNSNSWSEWKRYVVESIKELNDRMGTQEKCLNDLKINVAVLKTKAAIWGFVAGAIISALFMAGGKYTVEKMIANENTKQEKKVEKVEDEVEENGDSDIHDKLDDLDKKIEKIE